MKHEDKTSQAGESGDSNQASSRSMNEDGWRLIAKLEWKTSFDNGPEIHKQLETILRPFSLQADFVMGIVKSAQEALAPNKQPGKPMFPGSAHLLVFVLEDGESERRNWGFFRIVKIETASEIADPDRAIEFYLYREGR